MITSPTPPPAPPSSPPAAAPQAAHWSTQPPPSASTPRAARSRPWRDRLPELVGGIGTVLVLAAVAGFLSARWEQLDELGRAIVLGGAAAGLTAGAMLLERRASQRLRSLTSMVWVAGSATAGAAVLLATSVALPEMARITALVAGVAVAAHALLAARRDPDSPLRQLGIVAGLVFAAGPFGTGIDDRATVEMLAEAARPLVGLVDPTLTSDAFLITGLAHLVLGAAWLLWSRRTDGDAARWGWIGSTTLLAYAALELNVLPWGVGAFGALLIVLGYLVHGLVEEHAAAVVVGAIGVLIAGGRVLWSLFSGEVAVTVAAFTVGLALLTWAVRSRSAQDAAEAADA